MNLSLEQRIIQRLLFRSSQEKDVGLYHGKMGLIIFFAQYFKQTGLPVYDDTVDELMDELVNEIHKEFPVGFASGLSGIGWGIEYLIQNGFMEGDSLEVCKEIDRKIMERDIRRITDYSVETGLEGILHYVLLHIKGVIAQHSEMPFDEVYLFDLYRAVSTIPENVQPSNNFKLLSGTYATCYENRTAPDYVPQLSFITEIWETEGMEEMVKSRLKKFPLGLRNGLSGFLLQKTITG